MKRGSWLLMILQGMLNHGTKCCRYRAATPSLVILVVQGINFAAFEQLWSTIVSPVLKPFELGRFMIMSIATIWKGPKWGSITICLFSCQFTFSFALVSVQCLILHSFAFLCTCLIAYICMVLGHILHDT